MCDLCLAVGSNTVLPTSSARGHFLRIANAGAHCHGCNAQRSCSSDAFTANELRAAYFLLVEAVKQSIHRACKTSELSVGANALAVVFDLLSIVAIDYSSEDLPFLARSGIVEFLNDVVHEKCGCFLIFS